MSVTLDHILICEPSENLTDEMIKELEIQDLMIEFNIKYEEADTIRTFFLRND